MNRTPGPTLPQLVLNLAGTGRPQDKYDAPTNLWRGGGYSDVVQTVPS